MAPALIISFDDPQADLETAGGKGMNLARLARLGFPVPRGFIVPTAAYRRFVEAGGLRQKIQAALEGLPADEAAALERASQTIRTAFSAGSLPAELAAAVRAAYAELGAPPVAVRSSATAEDLPDLSFAGQQDTYLNVTGADRVLEAVLDCWSSLWTARAIGYRLRNRISQEDAALAVVVQEMVQSEVSGVLFTANPLTGLRSEAVIDATLGLGEALVSGQVEPDHYVVDTRRGAIVSRQLGEKKLSIRGKPGGGVETIAEEGAARQALPDEAILRLASLGERVRQEYGSPQDIEWALANGELYLLQARPITSLFPVPEESFDPLKVWFSFGAVQGVLTPITPLGRDTILLFAAGGARLFGVRLEPDRNDFFTTAGERIWIKISDVIRNPIGRRIFLGALGFIEPSAGQIVKPLAADPRLRSGRLKFSTFRRLAGFFLPILARALHNVLDPAKARRDFDAAIESYLAEARVQPAADRFGRLSNAIAFLRERLTGAFRFLLPKFIPVFGPSLAALNLLHEMSVDQPGLALEATRGLPRNVTTEMDLALWDTARALQKDPASAGLFRSASAPKLAAGYLAGTLPPTSQAALADFMERYGVRGVGEIDIGRPRWRDQPEPVIQTLQSYLQIDPELAPDVLFEKGRQAADLAVEKLAAEARRQPGGWFKQRAVRGAARRIRLLMGARESPKFFAIRMMGMARRALLEVGQEFVEAGTIEQADDLFFLRLADLEALSRNEARDWKALVAQARSTYEREARRKQVPRVLASDGRAFYEGLGSASDTADVITGSPVSPGVVEGIVHVVFDPHQTRLAPGEILVCPGTDPAWTPLFMAAGGLITEVGGMMTHGSVVAREYGIPAVVGVHQATTRLKDGQRVRVDGTAGKIVVIG